MSTRRKNRFVWKWAAIAPIFVAGVSRAGGPYYVDNCGDNTYCDGTTTACFNGGAGSPHCAKKTIQAGINATTANGEVVIVANGTYTGTGNKSIEFTEWGNQTPRLITVRSANGAESCIIDLEESGYAFNFRYDDVGAIGREALVGTPEALIGNPPGVDTGKGFTIKNGDSNVGAIWIQLTSPTIRDCRFEYNDGYYGGAISIEKDANPLIEGCEFEGNSANYGGAIGMRYDGFENLSPKIRNCSFVENEASVNGGAIYGDGVWDAVISESTITENIAASGGGGVYIKYPYGNMKFANTWITNNNSSLGSPPKGGGLYLEGHSATGEIVPELMNCIIAGNKASSGGGLYASGRSRMAVANSVFYQNTATDTTNGGHAVWYDWAGDSENPLPSKANIANSILWHSSLPSGVLVRGTDSALRIEESDVRQASLSGIESSDNINDDPDFVNAANGDYHLQNTSPCIDNGDETLRRNDYADLDKNGLDDEELTPVDLDLALRIVGPGCAVDMGAYEYLFGGCPSSDGISATPPDGTQDARRPHPKMDCSIDAREGIGDPTDPPDLDKITVTLTNGANAVCGAESLGCWTLCETGIETVDTGQSCPTPGDNTVSSVTPTATPGVYEVQLTRPISGGHWTMIEYSGGGSVSYASLPDDVNRSGAVTGADIFDFIDCCYNSVCEGYDAYSCDLNHSGSQSYDDADYDDLMDMIYGYGKFILWYGTDLADNECLGEGMMAMEGREEFTSADFTSWFVSFMVGADPNDSLTGDRFTMIVRSLTQWCLDFYTVDDLSDLADALSDPGLAFASDAGKEAAAAVVATITE